MPQNKSSTLGADPKTEWVIVIFHMYVIYTKRFVLSTPIFANKINALTHHQTTNFLVLIDFPSAKNTVPIMNKHAQALGRLGGKAKSPAKLQAAASNLSKAHAALANAGYPHLARARAARSAKAALRRSKIHHNPSQSEPVTAPHPHQENPA